MLETFLSYRGIKILVFNWFFLDLSFQERFCLEWCLSHLCPVLVHQCRCRWVWEWEVYQWCSQVRRCQWWDSQVCSRWVWFLRLSYNKRTNKTQCRARLRNKPTSDRKPLWLKNVPCTRAARFFLNSAVKTTLCSMEMSQNAPRVFVKNVTRMKQNESKKERPKSLKAHPHQTSLKSCKNPLKLSKWQNFLTNQRKNLPLQKL